MEMLCDTEYFPGNKYVAKLAVARGRGQGHGTGIG